MANFVALVGTEVVNIIQPNSTDIILGHRWIDLAAQTWPNIYLKICQILGWTPQLKSLQDHVSCFMPLLGSTAASSIATPKTLYHRCLRCIPISYVIFDSTEVSTLTRSLYSGYTTTSFLHQLWWCYGTPIMEGIRHLDRCIVIRCSS